MGAQLVDHAQAVRASGRCDLLALVSLEARRKDQPRRAVEDSGKGHLDVGGNVVKRCVAVGGFFGSDPKRRPMIEVSRTLMKSEPELCELVEAVEGVEVTMAEKGFGTRVEIRAGEDSGLSEADLERLLDDFAEPQKQPFGSA